MIGCANRNKGTLHERCAARNRDARLRALLWLNFFVGHVQTGLDCDWRDCTGTRCYFANGTGGNVVHQRIRAHFQEEAQMKSNVEASFPMTMRTTRFICRTALAAGSLFGLIIGLVVAPGLRAQVTSGKKPELPPPFASKSATNPAEEGKPP